MIYKVFSKLEKGDFLLLLVFIASLSPFIASGANFYVDASAATGGAATQVSGYDLSRGCEIADNIVLTAPPAFVSTKLDSPDLCRPRESRNPTWAKQGFAWTDDGKYPDYIGAVEPLASSPLIINLR